MQNHHAISGRSVLSVACAVIVSPRLCVSQPNVPLPRLMFLLLLLTLLPLCAPRAEEQSAEATETPAAAEASSAKEEEKPTEAPPANPAPAAADKQTVTPGVPEGVDVPTALLKAEEFEQRGEDLSAQMEYASALRECLLHVQNDEEKTFNLAQAEFLLEKLLDISARTGERNDLLNELQTLRKTMPLPPLTTARLDWALLTLQMRAGDAVKAREIADKLGFLRNWALQEGATQAATTTAATTPAAGKVKPVPVKDAPASETAQPRFLTVATADGLVPLDCYLPDLRLRDVRMTTIIEADNATGSACLRLGAGAPVTGYLNGRPFFTAEEARYPGFDLSAWGLQLQKGKNVLTLEFRKTPDFPAAFYARLTAPDGSALTGVSYPAVTADDLQPPVPLKELTAAGEVMAPLLGATQDLSQIVKATPTNHRAGYYLGWLLCKRQTLGANAPAARQLLLQAARLSPQTTIYLIALASADMNTGRQLPDRDNNLSRMALLKALELDPKNVAALNLLAAYYLDCMNIPSEAEKLAERALECNPGSPQAGILLCRIYRQREWGLRALKKAEELVKRNPAMPSLRLLKADLDMGFSTAADALKEISPARAADHISEEIFAKNLIILQRMGKTADERQLLQQRLALYPTDNGVLRNLARWELTAGDPAKALQTAQEALTVNPYDGQAAQLLARALQKQGKEQEALTAFEHALSVDAANPGLRDYLAFRGRTRPSPLTVIPDLAEYVQQFSDYRPAGGEEGVFLLHEQCDEVHDNGTKRRTIHMVVRIPDQRSAEKNRRIPVWYDGDTEEADVGVARVLHADGQISTGQTVPIQREGDRQVNLVVFPALNPGDVLELEYAVDQVRPDFFGDYFGHIHAFRFFSPVKQSRYVLLTPKGKQIYLHTTGGAPEPQVQEKDGQTVRTWLMSDLPAIEPLPLMPPLREVTPTVEISTFKDWDALAKWYWNLVKDQNLSNGEIKEKMEELAASAQTPQEKLAAIFGFVTNEVRNNAWEFGVHGYKPYNAGAIFTRRFGDCKDKATLINVMAREAGLEAWPVLVRATDPGDRSAGRGTEDLTLPILAHFNHCISMVMAGGKRYYLDGTIMFHTIDALPFTDMGAEGIIVRPEGAERVAMPAHTPERNAWDQDLSIKVDDKGAADFEDDFSASGQGAAYLRSWFRNPQTWDNVMRNVCTQKYGRVAAVVVEDVGEAKDKPNTVEFKGRVRIADFAKPTSKGLTLRLPVPLLAGDFGKSGAVPESFSAFAPTSARSLDVVLPTLFSVKRKIRLEWPDGWLLSDKLEPQEMKTDFGTLKVTYSLNGNLLEIDYEAVLSKQRIPVSEYKEFRRFCTAADRLSQFNFSLVKE